MNEITVSYDQNIAVRIHDRAKLVAEPRSVTSMAGCRNCAAASGRGSCYEGASKRRVCWKMDRNDRRDIYWRLKNV